MKRLKNITILLCFLSLLAFIRCSAEDKTGSSSGGSSETGTGGSGSGSETGGSGTGGSGTGTGGSGEGGSGEVTPPSEPETTEEGYFPLPEGDYRYDSRMQNYVGSSSEPTVSYIAGEKTQIKGTLILYGSDGEDGKYRGDHSELTVSKWKKTTKNGKIIKLEGERDKGHGCYTVTFDYETKTISGTFKYTVAGADWSFSGTKR